MLLNLNQKTLLVALSIFTLNGCAIFESSNYFEHRMGTQMSPKLFKKKPKYWVDWRTKPWSQLEVNCWSNPFNDNSVYPFRESDCLFARKNIVLMIEKEVFRLGYGKKGKTKLSDEEKYTVVENVKKKLTYEKQFLR